MVRLTLVLHGTVQGVGMRYFVQREARKLGLVGFVYNDGHGTVQIVAEGEQAALESLEAFCRSNPGSSRVTSLDAGWGPATGNFKDFTIDPIAS